MKKDRLRKSMKSFIRSHIDLEREEQLKERKSEIGDNVKKALKLIKNEDLEDKAGTDAGDLKKEPLAELILDLHQKYESLYGQYDHLTRELKKQVHAKQDKESSSSSSSDSDSDSSKDRVRKNGNLENDLRRTTDSFKQELEIAKAENADLRRKLTDATSQNEALSVDYHVAVSKIQEEEENTKELRTNAQISDNEISRLVLENKDLHQKLDIAAKIEAELNQRLEDTERDKDNLLTDKDTAMHRIEQEEKAVDDLKDATSRFKYENAFLQEELQAVKEEVCHLKQLLESAQSNNGQSKEGAAQAEFLMKENEGLQAQISELKAALEEREEKIKTNSNGNIHSREEKEGSEAKNIELEKVLAERDAECLALKGKLEQEGKEAFAQITHLKTQVNSLKEELDSLQVLKHQTEQQFEIERKKFSESLNTTENEKLIQENKQIEASLQDCQVRLQDAEKQMGKMAEQFHKKSGSKDSMVTYLEDIIEDLKRDLEVKKDEVHTLIENARAVELKHRLSNQKVRITDQLLNEKEESFKEFESRYQQKVITLEERIAKLCLALNNHQNMIRDISEYVHNKLTALETVVEKCVEKCEYHEHYILEVLKELQTAKNFVTHTRNEKKKLRQEVNQLTVQLESEKEKQLLLKKQTENFKVKFGSEEGEMENLAKLNNKLENKIEHMERNISCLEEEKREAIRQLCMWTDYHQSRYNRLKEMISKVVVGNQRIA